jgi:hypothetical protein
MTVDGTWNTSAKTPLGHMKGKLVLKTEGNTLSGTSSSQWGSDNFSNGKVDGDSFEFLVTNKTPMGPMKVEYKGKVEGDKMSGLTTTKPLGLKTPFEGTRITT